MELNLVTEGLKFMVLGMVTVFLFLILMVIILHFQAKLINKLFPQKSKDETCKRSSLSDSHVRKNDKVVVAIIGAIEAFKSSK